MRDVELIEDLCDRFLALADASGLQKQEFAQSVGLTGPKLTNIKNYRNPPPHKAIMLAAALYGVTTDFFYTGAIGGFRDEDMAKKLRAAMQVKRSPSAQEEASN